MIRTVVVPVDGSPLSEQAVPYGASLARHMNAALLLVHAVPIPVSTAPLSPASPGVIERQIPRAEQIAHTYLHALTQRLQSTVPVSYVGLMGEPAESIVYTARKHHASYIVMGTRGQSGLVRRVLGSVTDRVLGLAECPVLILHPQDPQDAPSIDLDTIPHIQRIVVALDGSPVAEQVLPHVRELSQAYNSEIHLFHAIPVHPPRLDSSKVADALAYLKGQVEALRADGCQVRYQTGRDSPADAILAYANEIEADLIAMTTRARAGITRVVLGSVADRVIRTGNRPVLVVRPTASHLE